MFLTLRLGGGHQDLVTFGGCGVHVEHHVPEPLVVLGIFLLNGPQLVRRHHRDAGVDRVDDLDLVLWPKAVAEDVSRPLSRVQNVMRPLA